MQGAFFALGNRTEDQFPDQKEGPGYPTRYLGLKSAQIDAGLVGVVALGFVLVLSLALTGGGYEPNVRNPLGVLVWWVLLVGVVAGLLPLRDPGWAAIVAGGLFTLFVSWTALSLDWTETSERTMADLGRVATFLGVFLLALAFRASLGVRRMVGAVGAAVAVVAAVALVSRLLPEVFPEAAEMARSLPETGSRLGFPLDYWNGLAVFVALGLPLLLHLAASADRALTRSAAAAALPMLFLVIFLTYSRNGVGVVLIGVAVYFLFSPDRLARILTLALAAAFAAPLVLLADSWEFVADGPVAASTDSGQGVTMLLLVVVVSLLVGAIQVAIWRAANATHRPDWTRPSRRTATWFGIALGALALVASVVFLGSGKAGDAWEEFKAPVTVDEQGADRFKTINGNHRYQFWQAAVDQNATKPLTGRGSGSFEFWSNRSEETAGFVRDAHSLYLETLGELGWVGLFVLLGFFGFVLAVGTIATLKSSQRTRSQLAAALAGCSVFVVAAAVDWSWELGVIPVAFLLLASVLVTSGYSSERTTKVPWWGRLLVALISLPAIAVILIPFGSNSLIEQSREAGREGNLSQSLELAREASQVEPGAATPYVQQALVLEAAGNPAQALKAAREAVQREPTNWRTWLIKFRLETATGEIDSAILSYRQVRRLNSNSSLFGFAAQ